MARTQRRYGSIPPDRRRLAVLLCLAVGVAAIVGGVLVNYLTGTSVRWVWLLVAGGFAIGFAALYAWIRLSD
jgi:hypothetical protein